jgi:hypothetical protein
MPSFPLKPRYDVAINYRVNGRICSNVLHYTAPAVAPTAAVMQNVATDLSLAFAPMYKNLLSQASRFEGVEVRYLAVAAGRYAVGTEGNGIGNSAGAAGANPELLDIPTEVAAIIQKFGDGPPKTANGTAFISGLPEGMYTGGLLTISGVESVQAIGDEMTAPILNAGGEGVAVNLSRKDAVLYPIIGYNVPMQTGSLRRRRGVR